MGVVWSQRTNGFYEPPGSLNYGYEAKSTDSKQQEKKLIDHMQGLYSTLLDGRFLFDFVHEEDLGLETVSKYSALLLPNVAVMSDAQCEQLREYVRVGGSLLATFETSLYNEWGEPRSEFGLADLFGINKTGSGPGREGRVFYSRIEQQHEILQGFQNTNWLPGGEYRVAVKSSSAPVLTVVPPYPQGIPEMVYAHSSIEKDYPGPFSKEPGMVLAEMGKSRLVYFPGDIDRCIWLHGVTDLSRLLQNAIRWMLRNRSAITVTGEGLVEIFAWETEPGYAVHILNYNNPNMSHVNFKRFYSIGAQHIRMELPKGVNIERVELLRAETRVPYEQKGDVIEFVIPSVEDYEVAAIYRSH